MQIFDGDGKSPRVFPVPGWRREAFSEPQVALDRDGSPWVTVPLEKDVRHYSADGKLLKTIRSADVAQASFDWPMGIAIAPSGGVVFLSDLAGGLVRLSVDAR
jgi:hypothetical protein